jgi:transcriptional regulator with XRE-family HTH domain
MADADREMRFNAEFTARVRAWRDERGWTADQMATALGVPPDRYRKYESRSPLPAYLIEPFALICEREVSELVTGRSTARQLQRKVARLSRVAE